MILYMIKTLLKNLWHTIYYMPSVINSDSCHWYTLQANSISSATNCIFLLRLGLKWKGSFSSMSLSSILSLHMSYKCLYLIWCLTKGTYANLSFNILSNCQSPGSKKVPQVFCRDLSSIFLMTETWWFWSLGQSINVSFQLLTRK